MLCKTNAHQLSLPCSHLTALETMRGKVLKRRLALHFLAWFSCCSSRIPIHWGFPVCFPPFSRFFSFFLALRKSVFLCQGHTDLDDVCRKRERRCRLHQKRPNELNEDGEMGRDKRKEILVSTTAYASSMSGAGYF